jgi:hypothetical protein
LPLDLRPGWPKAETKGPAGRREDRLERSRSELDDAPALRVMSGATPPSQVSDRRPLPAGLTAATAGQFGCAHIDLIKPVFARTLILQGHLECQGRPKANEDGRVDTFF